MRLNASFATRVRSGEKTMIHFEDAWGEVPKEPPFTALAAERAKANSIRYQLRAISDIRVIEWFSDAGFLPRYGFPIHLATAVREKATK